MSQKSNFCEYIKDKKTIIPINKGKCQLVVRYLKKSNDLIHTKSKNCNAETRLTNGMNLLKLTSKIRTPSNFHYCLKDLSNMDNPLSIIVKIEKNMLEFEEFLKSQLAINDIFALFGVFKLLYPSSYRVHLLEVLSKTLVSEFIEHLRDTIGRMNAHYLIEQEEATEEFMESLSKYCEITLEIIPTSLKLTFKNLLTIVQECLDKVISTSAITSGKNWKFLKDIKVRVQETYAVFSKTNLFEVESLTVHPINFMKKGHVEKNIISGPYESVKHYIETHFRLLKEDFEESLRTGIKSYKERNPFSSDKLKNTEIDVYKDIRLSVSNSPKINGHVVIFQDLSPFRKICWNDSKIFMNGSLVVLSNDNFNRCYLAVVKNRCSLEKGRGFIRISFLNKPPPYSKKHSFVLLECTNFFEPYFQVLSALLNMPHKNFPMYKYIISAETDAKLPKYVNGDSVYNICGRVIKICDERSWPQPDKLGLDKSQMYALRTSLTSEFSLIQGPPGTGKTYICIKIIEALLDNVSFCQGRNPNPILVVCYKNHALDQVLGELLKKQIKVLRFGGQSKNQELKNKFNVQSVGTKKIGGIRSLLRALQDLNKDMIKIQRKIIDCYQVMSGLQEGAGTVQLSVLTKVISPSHYAKIKTNFLSWLLNDIAQEVDINKIVNICEQYAQDIKNGKLSVVNNPPVPENGSNFEILKACDSFKEEPPCRSISLENFYELSLYDLEITMKVLRELIYFKCSSDLEEECVSDIMNELNIFKACLTLYTKLRERLKDNIKYKSTNLRTVTNINSLNCEQRWQLYTFWKQGLHTYYEKRVNSLQKEHDRIKIMFDELNDMKKVKKIQNFGAKVIGATTTGAARCQRLITELKPKIVILEEAAEVLEAHAVVSLSTHCQHVILIGDHLQLRPNPYSYHLSEKYHLNISLFERMIKNGLSTPILTLQHRMRPEIAALISPSIYSDLENHSSVKNFPNILGVNKNLYFINHDIPENTLVDSLSKMNTFEGDFLLNLCLYLLHQGYKPEEITILATYVAQKDYMLSERVKRGIHEDVNITVVDNFQGEENRIILLSLVRSNANNTIGFLSVENRVCVALSRAKEGLYIIGNMASLEKRSQLWVQINDVLTNNDCISKRLPLKCKTHRNITLVSSADDIAEVLEEGCGEICNVKMICGHICPNFCHSLDTDHKENFRCTEKCERLCENRHRCPAICGDACPPCPKLVDFELDCGHIVVVECYLTTSNKETSESETNSIDECISAFQALTLLDMENDIDNNNDYSKLPLCKEPCNWILKCGHTCTRKCHVNDDPLHEQYLCGKKCELVNSSCPVGHRCTKKCHEKCSPCEYLTKRKLPCGHIVKKECYITNEDIEKCSQICNKKLTCGHKCQNLCCEPCGECKEIVEKVIKECGHKVKVKCSEKVNHSLCTKMCSKLLSCGHSCKRKCSKPCDSSCCKEPVTITSASCGHLCKVPCHVARKTGELHWKDIFTSNCNQPCKARLGCGHICTGTCGECMHGKLHKKCTQKCRFELLCGHLCTANCTDDVHLCNQPCQYKCRHNKTCKGRCSMPCKKNCNIKCGRNCEHFICKKNCSELCNDKCLKECQLILPCGHKCSGICGNKCPSICTNCSIYIGNKTTRYIVLEDCGHTIDINTLDKDRKENIGFKPCPKCKKPIIKTLFYKEEVDLTFQQLSAIKSHLSQLNDLSVVKNRFSTRLQLLKKEGLNIGFPEIVDLVKLIVKTILPFVVGANKINYKSITLKSLYFVSNYVLIIIEELKKIDKHKTIPKFEGKILKSRINLLIAKLKDRALDLSEEQMQQFRVEFINLKTILDTYKILFNENQMPTTDKTKLNCDIMVDSIYCKLNGQKTSNAVSKSYLEPDQSTAGLDLPFAFRSKSMHKGDWLNCTKNHLYRSLLKSCPQCANDRK